MEECPQANLTGIRSPLLYLSSLNMLSPTFLALLFVVTTSVAANPLDHGAAGHSISFPFTRRVNVEGTRDLLKSDQARAQRFKNPSSLQPRPKTSSAVQAILNAPVTNGVVSYTMSVCTL